LPSPYASSAIPPGIVVLGVAGSLADIVDGVVLADLLELLLEDLSVLVCLASIDGRSHADLGSVGVSILWSRRLL